MIWHDFQRPASVEPEDDGHSATFARFLAQPFERGWGTTLGNALRRALLSSIPSAAITAVKIEGADHEFSAVPGVVEDVTDIILNLKKIPLRIHGGEPAFLTLEAKGPGEITAGQFSGSSQVEVIDPAVHVATLSAGGKLKMMVRVAQGRGYVPAEENHTDDLDVGFIPVDSAHSPVRKANFRVEMARLGRMTNYERLVLEVWTNGTVSPEEALSQAAQLVQGHLDIYTRLAAVEESNAPVASAAEPIAEDSILDASIDSLELSIRSMNCLKNANIRTLRDLVSRSEREMVEIRNFGEKSLKEVRSKLEVMGLGFGMNLDL
ncbi:MAG: DNA-directed RNA polymerase subunit alpha [Thermoanaerobaculales bacterium]|jgi:DNA-directed RNA polymerase subunit alpha|nr:DNA-directed RNA polymerase subunit alpha [Thermoanaerobaculales bacterium]